MNWLLVGHWVRICFGGRMGRTFYVLDYYAGVCHIRVCSINAKGRVQFF
jgi:hypothetical protein